MSEHRKGSGIRYISGLMMLDAPYRRNLLAPDSSAVANEGRGEARS